jgi:nitrogen fixation/metabolism regulation signal transduction histidine kinase
MARQVAHEIKNPLTPMKLMLQQLRATAKEDPAGAAASVEEVAKIVLEQIEALSRIASDFSAFARFPQRTLVDVNVNLLVSSVCALYGAGDEAGSTVDAELADELPPVRWDVDELRRVFVNVVANAVQSLDEAKGSVHVLVRSSPASVPGTGKEGCLVTVTDDGVGIPPENRGRLFEPEFSTKSSGTGLGLAIVKRILTDLGGEIAIESEPGRGTVVSIWLPRSDPQAPPPHATPYPFASTPALPLPPTSATPP